MKNLKLILGILMIVITLGYILLTGGDVRSILLLTNSGFTMDEKVQWTEEQENIVNSIGVDTDWYIHGSDHIERTGAIYKYLYGDAQGLPPLIISFISLELVILTCKLLCHFFEKKKVLSKFETVVTGILYSIGICLLSGYVVYPLAQWIYVLLAAGIIYAAKAITLPTLIGSILMIVFALAVLFLFFYMCVYKESNVTVIIIFGFFRNLFKPDFPLYMHYVYVFSMYAAFCYFLYWLNTKDEGAMEEGFKKPMIWLVFVLFYSAGLCLLFKHSTFTALLGIAFLISAVYGIIRSIKDWESVEAFFSKK